MTDTVLGILAKPPEPGKVKTRLCPPLTPVEAAAFYQASLKETINNFSHLPCDVVLIHADEDDYFRLNFPETTLSPQGDGNLGARIERALGGLLNAGYRRAALIGSDSPDLPPELVGEAFAALHAHDCVTIPSRDGGYVLIGESRHVPELFVDIPWSTPDVLAKTRQRACELGVTYSSVGEWEDCDDWPTVLTLLERSPDSSTAEYVRANLAHYL
jgi:rSAM/selenodomain-associated transferase 1